MDQNYTMDGDNERLCDRGGARRRVGRRIGSNRYGEPAAAVRIPVNLVAEVEAPIRRRKHTQPRYVVGSNG